MKLRWLLLIPCLPVLIGFCLVGWVFYVIGDMEKEAKINE